MAEKKKETNARRSKKTTPDKIIDISLVGVALAMGICAMVVAAFGTVDINNGAAMLGLGLGCLALYLIRKILPE